MSKVVKVNLSIFICSLIIYFINRLTNDLYTVPYISYVLRYHFNDYLAGIVFLAYLNLLFAFSQYKHIELLKWIHVLAVGILIGIFWEYVTPLYKSDSTSDILDVAAYTLGAASYKLLYSFVSRKCRLKEQSAS